MKKLLYIALLLESILITMPAFAQSIQEQEDTVLVNLGFRTTDTRDLVGAVSYVDMEELLTKNYSTYSLDNMQSFVGGYTGNLWNQGTPLILIDGVPRDAGNIHPNEIAQITFLKSAQAVVLFGSTASKGAILITTKRGKEDSLRVRVGGNVTLYVPKRYPKYLGSAQYMTLYNEALANDGLDPVYSQEDIYHYANHDDPYRYPELNFFSDEYLNKTYQRYDVNAEFTGGGKFAKFYAYFDLYHLNDLIDFGEGKNNYTNRLAIRGNVDMRFNSWATGWVDASTTFYDNRYDLANYWYESSVQRPTSQYPLTPLIPIERIDNNDENSSILAANSSNVVDGKYLLGGTQLQQTNAFANMYAAGYGKNTSRQLQFDVGVKLDLKSILKGLSFKTHFGMDYATSYTTSINNDYSTYEATWNTSTGKNTVESLTKYGTDKTTATQNISGSYTTQTIALTAQFDYDRNFSGHNVVATLLANGYQQTISGSYHRTSNANLGLQAAYNWKRRYYADLSMAALYSAKLAPGHRIGFSPVGTIGWRISEEPFMNNVNWLDDLRLTASLGVIKEDVDLEDYYLYEEIFTANGQWWGWSETNSYMQTSLSTRGKNYDLDFVKRKEWRIGLQVSFLKGSINLDLNWFNVRTDGLVVVTSLIYPSYWAAWNTSFLPNTNYNIQDRRGLDFSLNLRHKFSNLDVQLGFNGMYYASNNVRISENNEYEWLNSTGYSIETLRGYKCLGYFQSEEEIASSAVINSDTKPGDLKYEDINGDGVINYQDMVVLGKSIPSFTYGINFTLKWKDFTLFILGNGNCGGKALKDNLTNWIYGDRKYTEVVLGRWTPETAETATYPRLTTQSGDLNFVSSDYWMYSTSAFYLTRAQLTWDMPDRWFDKKFVKSMQLYFYGADLLTISPQREYLETNVGAVPQCRSFNLGFKLSF